MLTFPILPQHISSQWKCLAYCTFLSFSSLHVALMVTLQGWLLTNVLESDKGVVTGQVKRVNNSCFPVCQKICVLLL